MITKLTKTSLDSQANRPQPRMRNSDTPTKMRRGKQKIQKKTFIDHPRQTQKKIGNLQKNNVERPKPSTKRRQKNQTTETVLVSKFGITLFVTNDPTVVKDVIWPNRLIPSLTISLLLVSPASCHQQTWHCMHKLCRLGDSWEIIAFVHEVSIMK